MKSETTLGVAETEINVCHFDDPGAKLKTQAKLDSHYIDDRVSVTVQIII